jgi:hypothetical protein
MNYDTKLGYAWKKNKHNYKIYITENYDDTELGCVEKTEYNYKNYVTKNCDDIKQNYAS